MNLKLARKSKQKEYLLIALTLFLLTGVAIYFGAQKEGFHMDELYSYGLSNGHYNPFPFKNNDWLNGEYYQAYLTTSMETNFEYGSVFYNQSRDVHPPLYYILLHTISSFVPNVFSKWIGLSLNIVLHIFILIYIYKLVDYFTNNTYLGIVGMLFYGLSIGGISNLLFIRMYTLMTLFKLLLIYLSIKYFEKDSISPRNVIGLGLVTILGGLTQYYFYIFAGIVTISTIILLLITKKYKKMIVYAIQSASSVIIAFMIFPSVFKHISSTNRGNEVVENMGNFFSLDNLNHFLGHISNQIFSGELNLVLIILTLLVTVAFFSMYLQKKEKISYPDVLSNNNKIISLLTILISTSMYVIIVSQISHYKVTRYVYSVYPFVVILTVIVFYKLIKMILKTKKTSVILLASFMMFISLKGLLVNEPGNLKKGMDNNHQTIQKLNTEETNSALLLTDSTWRLSSTVNELRLFDSVYPAVINSNDSLPMDNKFSQLDSVVIYIFNEYDTEILHKEISSTYNLENEVFLYNHDYFNVYLFSK